MESNNDVELYECDITGEPGAEDLRHLFAESICRIMNWRRLLPEDENKFTLVVGRLVAYQEQIRTDIILSLYIKPQFYIPDGKTPKILRKHGYLAAPFVFLDETNQVLTFGKNVEAPVLALSDAQIAILMNGLKKATQTPLA